jgi:single-stranded DNA-binding protein
MTITQPDRGPATAERVQPDDDPLDDVSVTLVIGTLSRPAEIRVLPSGDTLIALEVTARRLVGAAETMPVSWPGAPAWAGRLDAGERVVVLGRVRRRFYRAGATTVSRTEIVADRVVPTRQRARSRSLVERAATLVDGAVAVVDSGRT